MRFLLLAMLCLFGAPAHAVFLQPGQYQVYGDFGDFGITGTLYASVGFAEVVPGTYNPDTGPYYGYQMTVRANSDAIVQSCFFSQTQSMCGRFLHNSPNFFLSDFNGDGMELLTISGGVSTTNMTTPELFIEVSLPPGFVLASSIPEPSTWLMMLIGFAGLMIVRNDRQPLRRVRRLLQRLQQKPHIAPKRTGTTHQVV